MNWQTLSKLTLPKSPDVTWVRTSNEPYHGLIPVRVGQIWRHCSKHEYLVRVVSIDSKNGDIELIGISPDEVWNGKTTCYLSVLNVYDLLIDRITTINLVTIRRSLSGV